MAFKNFLKIYLEKGFFSFAGRRLASGPPAEAGPARQRSPRAAPAQRAGSFSRAPRPSPRRAPTASGRSRRVATMCRRRPPRGSHDLRPHPRARLQLPQPVHSLTPARAAFPLLQSREPKLRPSPRLRTRRQNSSWILHLGRQSRARSSASPSFKLCSRLRHLPSSGRAASASPPTAMAPPCSAAMEVTSPLFSSPA